MPIQAVLCGRDLCFDQFKPTIPATIPTATELTEMANILKTHNASMSSGAAPSASVLANALAIVESYNITIDSNGNVKGKPLFMSDFLTCRDVWYQLGRAARISGDTVARNAGIKLWKHILDQGFQKGSYMESSGSFYYMGGLSNCVLAMYPYLVQQGMWDEVHAFWGWFIGAGEIWDTNAYSSDMDYANYTTEHLFFWSLYTPDETLRRRNLKGFTLWQKTGLALKQNGAKV